MKLWKYTPLDALMLALSVGHFGLTLWLAASWERSTAFGRAGGFALLVFLTVYDIIVITHLFTHTPWFNSPLLNAMASMLNSVNAGQSAQAYRFTHVRNHHRYNNDRKGPGGATKDSSSTFLGGVGGEHEAVWRYALRGAGSTLLGGGRSLLSVVRLWRVGERALLELASASAGRRARELRQVRLDRMAHFLAVCLFLAVSWRWTLACYLPALALSLVLVNVQNYYEHFGAEPASRYADSVSYYGRLYNLLAFNDGYHQEHHLRPQAHWSVMPAVRRKFGDELDRAGRVVSPLPAILGALHRNRGQLHRRGIAVPAPGGDESSEAPSRSPAHV